MDLSLRSIIGYILVSASNIFTLEKGLLSETSQLKIKSCSVILENVFFQRLNTIYYIYIYIYIVSSFVPSAITQPFFELHTPDFAWKFVWTVQTDYKSKH